MKKLVNSSLAILALLMSHQAFAFEWVGGVKGEYVQAYGYSTSLYAYSYTINPMDLHQTYCEEHAAEACASITGLISPPLTINLLFSSKLGANEDYIAGPGFDMNAIVEAHPNQSLLPIPSSPLTYLGNGDILGDGSFFVNYGPDASLTSPLTFHAGENGDIAKWDVSWGRFYSGNTTNELDSFVFWNSYVKLEGSSTNLSSWVGTPISRYNLGFNVFVPSEVSTVPESDKYAMFLAGLGLVGLIARRRRAYQY